MLAPRPTAGPSRFNKLAVNGFRRLDKVDIELRPLTVMIGANGTGKTSVLDVMSLLAKSAAGKLNQAISDLSGLPAILTYDRAEQMHLGISMTVNSHAPLDYSLSLAPQGVGYTIESEALEQRRQQTPRSPFKHIESRGLNIGYFDPGVSKLVKPTWDPNPLETSLAQVPKMFREPEDLRSRLASSTLYHVLSVDPRAPVRLPQPMRPSALPGANGEELVSCLYYMRETDRSRFEAIEDALKAAFPGF